MTNPRRSLSLLLLLLASTLLITPTLDAQVVRQVTDHGNEYFARPISMDDAGADLFVNSCADFFGTNADHAWQIFRFNAVPGGGERITDLADGTTSPINRISATVSATDDGQWIAFISRSDPVGTNHDESDEIFVARRDGTDISQVTDDPAPNSGTVGALDMAGAGNRIVFLSNTDPLGTNTDHLLQIFIIDRDGTNLVQLTHADAGDPGTISISDDGTRVVFSHNGDLTGSNSDGSTEIYAVNADGTGLRQLTSAPEYQSGYPMISGNGEKVVFDSFADLGGLNPSHLQEVFVVNWDGSGLAKLTTSTHPLHPNPASGLPTITDDGEWVVFVSNQGELMGANYDASYEIMKIRTDGTGLTYLTDVAGGSCRTPLVSGSGNRIAFFFDSASYPGVLENPDMSYEILVMDMDGSNVHALTSIVTYWNSSYPDITSDGSRIVFAMDEGITTPGAEGQPQVFRVQSDGTDLFQLSELAGSCMPTVTADGSRIAFDHMGINIVNADGTGLTKIVDDSNARYPSITGDGSVILFESSSDLTGGNADGSIEVFSVLPDGTGLAQVTSGPTGTESGYARVDATGTWCTIRSTANLTGQNSDGSPEVFRMRTDGTEKLQASYDPAGPDSGG